MLPKEITNPYVDELSVMTYLSGFLGAQLKPGAPIKSSLAKTHKVKVYGSGIERDGLTSDVNIARFVVDVTEAGPGTVVVKVEGPNGKIDVFVEEKSNEIFDCSYVPEEAGKYIIAINYAGKAVPLSPYTVVVKGRHESIMLQNLS